MSEGDYQLVAEVLIGNDRIPLNPQTISIVANPATRLKRLEDGLKPWKSKPLTTQRATIAAHASAARDESPWDGRRRIPNEP